MKSNEKKVTLPKETIPKMERKMLKYIRIDKDIEYKINLFLLDKHRQTPKGTKKLTFGEFVEECVEFYFTHKTESEGQIDE
ncbi:hypothetical protein HMPREF1392_00198 [Helicobacter pylori GAM101Biv]|nr:hypothetical protein HMPREF1392_00198 [Helicobacter pylori GAM101Biv]